MSRTAVLVAAGALALVACQLIGGIEIRDEVNRSDAAAPKDATLDAIDAGAIPDGGSPSDGSAGGDSCNRAEPPDRPDADSPTQTNVEFFVAVKNMLYDTNPDAGIVLGYDLDGVCCPGAAPSCVSNNPTCTDPQGRETAGNSLLKLADTYLGSTANGNLNNRIAQGQLSLIFWVSQYNEGADDTQVNLTAFIASGNEINDAGYPQPPKWDDTDIWSIDPRSTLGASMDGGVWSYVPQYITTQAYVTSSTLVSPLGKVSIGLGAGSLEMTDAVLVAAIESDGHGGKRLDGQMAGRISTHSLLAILGAFQDSTGQYLCGSDVTFQTVRTLICSSADLRSDPTTDFSGQPCDALSVSFGFTALGVQTLGPPFQTLDPKPGCDGSVEDCP